MSWADQNRVPPGSPEGGEWAPGVRGESSDVSLGAGDQRIDVEHISSIAQEHFSQAFDDPKSAQRQLERFRTDLDDFAYAGQELRPETQEALGNASKDPKTAISLVSRDIEMAGSRATLSQVYNDHPESELVSRVESEVQPSQDDYYEAIDNPSPKLAQHYGTHKLGLSGDEELAPAIHRDAIAKAARRRYGRADTSSLTPRDHQYAEETLPGIVRVSDPLRDGRESRFYLSPERNAQINPRVRQPDGYYNSATMPGSLRSRNAHTIYKPFAGEASVAFGYQPPQEK